MANHLPERFPLPPGAVITRSVKDGSELASTVTVVDAASAYTFWKTSLPGAGYRVLGAQSVPGVTAEIRFSGHGCGGNSQIALSGVQAAVQCDLT